MLEWSEMCWYAMLEWSEMCSCCGHNPNLTQRAMVRPPYIHTLIHAHARAPILLRRYAIAAIIVFDLGRPATFESVIKWQRDLNEKVMLANEQPVPCILLANKCDLSPGEIDKEKLDTFCQDNGFLAWFATSAKDNLNIEEAMGYLVKAILEVAKDNHPPQPGQEQFLKLDDVAPNGKKKGPCSSCDM